MRVIVKTYGGHKVAATVVETYPEGSGKELNVRLFVEGNLHLYRKTRTSQYHWWMFRARILGWWRTGYVSTL